MKLWIRLDAGAPRDPKITEIARTLGVRRAEAFGLIASVWCVMAEHAVDGNLGAIADEDLEAWAYWHGKRGKFAAAFRSAFVGEDGSVGGWSERQGKLLDRMERDRKRHQKPETHSPEPPPNSNGNSAENPQNLPGDSTSTVRNGTVQKEKALSARSRSTPKAVPDEQKNGIPVPLYDYLHRAWTAQAGAVDIGRFRKTIKGMLGAGIRVGQIERAMPKYVAAMRAKERAIKLEWFAEDVQTWIRAADALALESEPPEDFGLTREEAAAKIAAHHEQLRIRDEALVHRLTTLEVVA